MISKEAIQEIQVATGISSVTIEKVFKGLETSKQTEYIVKLAYYDLHMGPLTRDWLPNLIHEIDTKIEEL